MIDVDCYRCRIELSKEGWMFYFFNSKEKGGDFEATVLKDFSLRIRKEGDAP